MEDEHETPGEAQDKPSKMQCACDKHDTLKFGCKNALRWFISKQLYLRIQRKLEETQSDLDVD